MAHCGVIYQIISWPEAVTVQSGWQGSSSVTPLSPVSRLDFNLSSHLMQRCKLWTAFLIWILLFSWVQRQTVSLQFVKQQHSAPFLSLVHYCVRSIAALGSEVRNDPIQALDTRLYLGSLSHRIQTIDWVLAISTLLFSKSPPLLETTTTTTDLYVLICILQKFLIMQ